MDALYDATSPIWNTWLYWSRKNLFRHIWQGDPTRCFLEFDLNCTNELHDLHNDYPLAAGKVKVTKEMLSYYQLQIIEDNNFFLAKNEKLFPNPDNKQKYKLHYQYLKLYLEIGLHLKKFIKY